MFHKHHNSSNGTFIVTGNIDTLCVHVTYVVLIDLTKFCVNTWRGGDLIDLPGSTTLDNMDYNDFTTFLDVFPMSLISPL